MTKRKKGQMARTLVWLCVSVLLLTLVWSAVLTTIATLRDTSVDLSDILTFAAATFGGELLMILLKRLLAKNIEEETQ